MTDSTSRFINNAWERAKSYTIIDNAVLRDPTLSFTALGLLGFMLSLPTDWQIRESWMIQSHATGQTAYRSALDELVRAGYVWRERTRDDSGRYVTHIVVDSRPRHSPEPTTGNPQSETHCGNSHVGKPTVGNDPLLITEYEVRSSYEERIDETLSTTPTPPSATPVDALPAVPVNSDAVVLATHLADWVERNGSKRPNVTDAWVRTIDRMIRLDGRTPEQIRAAIDWCQADDFWRANIMSPDKLRKQYDRLRLAAQRERGRTPAGRLDPYREYLDRLEEEDHD